ncbi:MAG TPA: thiamine pyrophosphate-dependent dehydrogenase E1 component subunit alpha [Thermoleophilaceae bacterium]
MTADTATLLDGYGRMLLLRYFEEAMQRLFLRGEIHGTVHLYTGQEAVSVGVCAALEQGDQVAATYRGHGAALAKGTEPEALAAELMGRDTGACGGRAGSMNVIDLDHGLLGCFGIVGGSIATATGAALTAQREGRVVVAFFGDGAANQAYFHECLNFAQVMHLPVVFVCENNGYGEFTPMAQVTAGGDIAARAATYGMPSGKVDGNDLEAVIGAATQAVNGARAGDGPSFIEALTYRHLGHSKSDPGAYRPEGELDSWLQRDPIVLLRGRLSAQHGVEDEQLDAVERETQERINHAIEAALEAPYPDPDARPATEYAP